MEGTDPSCPIDGAADGRRRGSEFTRACKLRFHVGSIEEINEVDGRVFTTTVVT